MPTSCMARTVTRGRDPQAGLTLIEVLVVLAIVGVMAGVTVLGLGALDRGARAEAEAMRLADRLQLASDAALTSGAPLALVWDAGGYRFDALGCRPPRPGGRASRVCSARATRCPPRCRLIGDASGGTPPLLITPERPQAPVELRIAGDDAVWAVRFDGVGATAGRGGRDARRARDAGFSLIEALVALSILAVSAISLLAATEAHVARIGGLESRALAQFVAENRLAELEVGIAGPDADPAVVMLGQEFRIAEARSPTTDPDLERIDLTVTDVARGETFAGFLRLRRQASRAMKSPPASALVWLAAGFAAISIGLAAVPLAARFAGDSGLPPPVAPAQELADAGAGLARSDPRALAFRPAHPESRRPTPGARRRRWA